MKYELAKKLKEAGFPQKSPNREKDEWLYYEPTLSELIEACGVEFNSLVKFGSYWSASANDFELNGKGSTPEEAVANLWLVLNSK